MLVASWAQEGLRGVHCLQGDWDTELLLIVVLVETRDRQRHAVAWLELVYRTEELDVIINLRSRGTDDGGDSPRGARLRCEILMGSRGPRPR